MSFAYDSDLEPTDEELAGETGDEYSGFFDEVDFAALGIDPTLPTDAKPGSEDKVLTLAARYAAGLPLWHTEDRYDHGPGTLEIPEFAGGAEDLQLEDE